MSQFEEKLIMLVSGHENLYNTKSRNYKNVLKRDSTWVQIAQELQKPVDECRQRWKSLRDPYVREKRKMDQPSGSGAAEPEVWEYFYSLQFLNEAIRPRSQIGNYDSFSDSLFELPQSPTEGNSFDVTECSTPEATSRKSAKRSKPDAPMTAFFGDLSKTLAERFKMEEPDENDIFLKMIGTKMKVLPPDAKIRLQEKFLKDVNAEILSNMVTRRES